VVVCGDGEYIIYTAMALRNKSFGSAQEFVWAADSSEYAVRESTSSIKLFKNFKERKTFKPEFGAENIFGGNLLGVKSVSSLAFYDWENQVPDLPCARKSFNPITFMYYFSWYRFD
jgi:coatomer subunit beta'